MGKNRKKDGLHSLVVGFPYKSVKRDNEGRYFPYCDSPNHQGLVLDENVCHMRNCRNYHKLYIERGNQEYGHRKNR